MLERFQRVAYAIAIIRSPALIFAGLSGLFIVSALLLPTIQMMQYWLMPAIILLLWSLSLYSFVSIFSDVPAAASTEMAMATRLKRTLKRGLYWLYLIVFIGLFLSTTGFSLRLIGIWFNETSA